jgi:Rrf2 family cysteine metabolism transcriptional repressor
LLLKAKVKEHSETMLTPDAISKKCRYALRAIFELSLRDTTEPVKVQDIAAAQSIPPRFLEVILAELKHAGFVESRRGSDGGYILARAADELTVGEVLSFLQGGTRNSTDNSQPGPYLTGDYVFSKMWQEVGVAVSNIYNSTTFADLLEQELAQRKAYAPDYAI